MCPKSSNFSIKPDQVRIRTSIAVRCAAPPKITRLHIAVLLGISRTALFEKLRGGLPWRSSELENLAAIVGVPADFFLNGGGDDR